MEKKPSESEIHERMALHAIVRGQVQGVGFRATTLHFAQQLHLSGGVRNLSDGSVEIIAYGKRIQLDELLNLLRRHMRIEDIKTTYSSYDGPLGEFKILH